MKESGVWLSLVERCVRDAEAGGSNPLTPTKNQILREQCDKKSLTCYKFFVIFVKKIWQKYIPPLFLCDTLEAL